MTERIELSVVVPLLNEAAVFDELQTRLVSSLSDLGRSFEVVLVDDGSTDGTTGRIQSLCAEDVRFQGLVFSRNFGHQTAVTAGLEHARGEVVAVLDGDLQDPPELLGKLLARLDEGFDVVYAVRRQRKEGILKRLCYAAFYRALRRVSAAGIPLDAGDFCVMRRCVVAEINSCPERDRFVRGLRAWVGFRQVGVEYERAARAHGRTKYSLRRLLGLAVDGVLSFSAIPLRVVTFSGLMVAGMAFVVGLRIFIWRLISDEPLPGFATLAVGLFFLGGVQLIALGIVGEYIGRIYLEVKGRPNYILRNKINFLPRCSE
jgi:dolichol-phosphate mannosyltransferase